MMVIMSTSGVNVGRIYPADRCTWTQSDSADGNGYIIEEAFFFDGTSSTGTGITNPLLGYIGKSGRFVPITDLT